MDSGIHRFNVGNCQCMAVSDGTFTYAPPTFPPPAIFLFANAPAEPREQVLHQHGLRPEQWMQWTSPYICLVINTGKHLVLVDTGAGNLGPDTGKLLLNLKTADISPEDIDTVILTHGHPDHIGGNTDDNGRLVFANARYVMWQTEWDFWTSGHAEAVLDEHSRPVLMQYARKNLPPIKRQLDLVEREAEVVTGIHVITTPGHTPGHMAVSVRSESEQLLCISDVVLHPIHLEHPEWYAAVDISPEQVVATRRRLLQKAAAERCLVLGFHLPFPGLGHVTQKAEKWQWQAIDTIG